MKMALVKLALATSAGLVTLAACGSENDGFDPFVPTAVEYVSGSGQSGDVGELLGELLTIRTVNLAGDPVASVEVEWFVISGDGTISSTTTTSDANGLAQVSWVLGPITGPQVVQAVAALTGSPVSFGATARAGPPDGGGGEPTILIR